MDGEDSFRDDESIRDDDASLAADDDEGSEAVADEASEVGCSAFSDGESEEPQSGGGDEGAAEGLAPVDITGVKLKLIGVTRPGEEPILDGAWAAAEAVRQEGERKRAEAAAQAKAAAEAKAGAEREQRRAELGEAAEYNPVKPKAERAIPPKQFWATVDELLARPPTSAAVGPPPLPPPPARCPLVDRLIAALLPGGVHGGAGGAAAAAVCGADAATLERTERRLRGSLHELGLLPARESLPPQLRHARARPAPPNNAAAPRLAPVAIPKT